MNETSRRNLSIFRDTEAMRAAIHALAIPGLDGEEQAAEADPTPVPAPSRKDVAPVVYFIRFGDDGPIKIGYARDTWLRFHNLQAGSPVELTYLGDIDGGRPVERSLHERFAHLRVRGEWFSPAPELLDYIAEALPPAI